MPILKAKVKADCHTCAAVPSLEHAPDDWVTLLTVVLWTAALFLFKLMPNDYLHMLLFSWPILLPQTYCQQVWCVLWTFTCQFLDVDVCRFFVYSTFSHTTCADTVLGSLIVLSLLHSAMITRKNRTQKEWQMLGKK